MRVLELRPKEALRLSAAIATWGLVEPPELPEERFRVSEKTDEVDR